MSEAYRCDRCHQYDEGKPVVRVTMEPITDNRLNQKWDMCPNCLAQLHDFLNINKETGEGYA